MKNQHIFYGLLIDFDLKMVPKTLPKPLQKQVGKSIEKIVEFGRLWDPQIIGSRGLNYRSLPPQDPLGIPGPFLGSSRALPACPMFLFLLVSVCFGRSFGAKWAFLDPPWGGLGRSKYFGSILNQFWKLWDPQRIGSDLQIKGF